VSRFPHGQGEGSGINFHSLCNIGTADWFAILFELETLVDPRDIVSDGGPDPPTARGGKFDAAFAILLGNHLLVNSY